MYITVHDSFSVYNRGRYQGSDSREQNNFWDEIGIVVETRSTKNELGRAESPVFLQL